MTQPTFLVHPEQLEDAAQRVVWQGIAASTTVLVVARLLAPGVPLAVWLARDAGTAGTG